MSLVHDQTEERVDTSGLDLEHKRELLKEALGTPRRYAILLMKLHGQTQAEIAEAVGISERHVIREMQAIDKIVNDLGGAVA